MKWTCKCGEVEAEAEPEKGVRLVCYCASCRKFVERLGAEERLDPAGGSDLWQTAPESVRITKGQANLAWVRLTKKGPLRWYATCCNTPMANTLDGIGLPFMTLQSWDFEDRDALGPVVARVKKKDATAHIEGDMGSMRRVIMAFAGRALKSRLSGGYRRNPFFDGEGKPIAAGHAVSDGD